MSVPTPRDLDRSGGLDRRQFLTLAGASGIGVVAGVSGSRSRFATPSNPGSGDVIVCLYLRGGADGLSLIPPYGEGRAYYDIRPTVAIPEPGQPNGALDLNGFFGMHPAMYNLYSTAWANEHLAIVHAAGLPENTPAKRSHFEAQDYMERGVLNLSDQSGWLGRHLAGAGGGSVPGVTIGSSLDLALYGYPAAVAMSSVSNFRVQGFPGNQVGEIQANLANMYGAAGGPLGNTAVRTISSVNAVVSANPGQYGPQNGAVYPNDYFARQLQQVGQLIRSGIGLRVACVNLGGWDLHDDMGTSADGSMAFSAGRMANALAAFYTDMGNQMNEVTVVVMSEFGRTIKENDSLGTDHGRGSVMMVMGHGIRGGVYTTSWPGLVEDDGDRDVLVTTDYRTVLSEVITRRGDGNAGAVFPGFASSPLGLTI